MHERFIRNNKGDFIGKYETTNEEREVFLKGKKLPHNTEGFPFELQNELDNILDDFEEGFNEVNKEEEYEFLQVGDFEVRRKIKNICYFFVECKDCKYYSKDTFGKMVCTRLFNHFKMKPNDFCSYGTVED